jgi:hypothetical protein
MLRQLVLPVCLVLASGLVATANAQGSWDWTMAEDAVAAGSSITVIINNAPGFPVEVRLFVDGTLRDHGDVTQPGGSVVLRVPSGTSGQSYKLELDTGTQQTSQSGTVQ